MQVNKRLCELERGRKKVAEGMVDRVAIVAMRQMGIE